MPLIFSLTLVNINNCTSRDLSKSVKTFRNGRISILGVWDIKKLPSPTLLQQSPARLQLHQAAQAPEQQVLHPPAAMNFTTVVDYNRKEVRPVNDTDRLHDKDRVLDLLSKGPPFATRPGCECCACPPPSPPSPPSPLSSSLPFSSSFSASSPATLSPSFPSLASAPSARPPCRRSLAPALLRAPPKLRIFLHHSDPARSVLSAAADRTACLSRTLQSASRQTRTRSRSIPFRTSRSRSRHRRERLHRRSRSQHARRCAPSCLRSAGRGAPRVSHSPPALAPAAPSVRACVIDLNNLRQYCVAPRHPSSASR